MELTGKQRAALRSLCNTLQPVLYIGKEGITDNLVKQCWDALEARELIKVTVQKNAPFDSTREACDALAEACRAEVVQVIGTKFVLYKRNEKEPKIELVKDRKK